MTEGQSNFGVAAFAESGVEDARRRRPDVDLSRYAASRGLAYNGSRISNVRRGRRPRAGPSETDDPSLAFMIGALGLLGLSSDHRAMLSRLSDSPRSGQHGGIGEGGPPDRGARLTAGPAPGVW